MTNQGLGGAWPGGPHAGSAPRRNPRAPELTSAQEHELRRIRGDAARARWRRLVRAGAVSIPTALVAGLAGWLIGLEAHRTPAELAAAPTRDVEYASPASGHSAPDDQRLLLESSLGAADRTTDTVR